MHWKVKASIQNLVGLLPAQASYSTYYWLQRRFGRLKNFDPFNWLVASKQTCELIFQQGQSPKGLTFFEIGTGWAPLMPMAYWLMGAKRTITVDLNPYLKDELIDECLKVIATREALVRESFGNRLVENRFGALLELHRKNRFSREGFLDLCGIDYLSGIDAAHTSLPRGSVDFHCSHTVLEHIAAEQLSLVIEEGNRITKDGGLFVHRIDYSDHFSHTDLSLSAINFLKFPERVWQRYAGNRYMYMNRLRHDDFLELFRSAGHELLHVEPYVDWKLKEQLDNGAFAVHEKFKSKQTDILATVGAWIVSKPVS